VAEEEATWRLAEALADHDPVAAVVETSALPATRGVEASAATAPEAVEAPPVVAVGRANPVAMAVAMDAAKG
jgi:hypothetical protein